MLAGKKLSDSEMIGDAGIALIHGRVVAMGHAWRSHGLDAGIDGGIELRDPATSVMSNRHILVQSKASNNPFPGETVDRFHYICEERDLDYWLKADQPVILVCSHPKTSEAWWVPIQSYFAEPARRADRRVDFSKATMAFEGDITDRLFAIADPEGRAHSPRPVRKAETLTSNLLGLKAPRLALSYATTAAKRGDVYQAQRDSGLSYRHDFAVWGGRLWTLTEVDATALGAAVRGEPDAHEFASLADDPSGERLSVQLLNTSLRDDLKDDCDFSGQRNLLYFRATADMSPRKWHTTGSNSRTVFKGYASKRDPSRMSNYRHAALSWQFIRAEQDWYCALTPDYFFTWNGMKESNFADSLLKKIKQFDRHAAVRQETLMWGSILQREGNLVEAQRSRILKFSPLETFSVELGINDDAWKRPTASTAAAGQLEFDLYEQTA